MREGGFANRFFIDIDHFARALWAGMVGAGRIGDRSTPSPFNDRLQLDNLPTLDLDLLWAPAGARVSGCRRVSWTAPGYPLIRATAAPVGHAEWAHILRSR